jgi:endogenous inhibitor of DNA gyrase (YacG/DUF329 family)
MRDELKKIYEAVGPCPYCGKKKTWLNDVPLRAFCWGTEQKPHREWHKLVPKIPQKKKLQFEK